jgi:hypothetical protein
MACYRYSFAVSLYVDGEIILNATETWCEGVDYIHLVADRVSRSALVELFRQAVAYLVTICTSLYTKAGAQSILSLWTPVRNFTPFRLYQF